MDTYKIGILESDNFSMFALQELQKLGEVERFNGRELTDFIENKDIIFIRLKHYIDEEFLSNAYKLKIICSPTTGLNHLDIQAIANRNIKVISLQNESNFLRTIRATPEHIFGLTLALLRNYGSAFLNTNNSIWDRDKYRGEEIYGNTVGIIGYGRIGRILTQYLLAFGAKVFAYDNNHQKVEQIGIEMVDSIEELINRSNIIILCASYSIENEKLINSCYIDLLEGKYFINAARGELVDENYLLKKIESNFFKGIALDVVTDETKDDNNLYQFLKLVNGSNFIVTPHIGGATFNSMHKTEEYITNKLISLLKQ